MRIPLFIFLVGFLAGNCIVQAQSTSSQYTISNPHVVVVNAGQSGNSSLLDRIGKSGVDTFTKSGGYTSSNSNTRLDTQLSQGLLELETNVEQPTEKIQLIHNGFMTVKSSKLYKDITYTTIQKLGVSGTRTEMQFTVSNNSRNLNSYLGNVVINIYTY